MTCGIPRAGVGVYPSQRGIFHRKEGANGWIRPSYTKGIPANSATVEFQAGERPGAGTELASLDSQTLQHVHVEIAEWRRVLRVERQVLPVLETAPRYEHGQVLYRMAAGIAQVASQVHSRPLEQVRFAF